MTETGKPSTDRFDLDQQIFDAFDRDRTGVVERRDVRARVEASGLKADDPRLASFWDELTSDANALDQDGFTDLCTRREGLLVRLLQDRFIIPRFDRFAADVGALFEDGRAETAGTVASYIPELARVDPENYGLGLCTVDGQRASYGDSDAVFCAQSAAKPITYARALERVGGERVHAHVGREPSGRSFNDIALNRVNKPHNPMINAGAIMCCALTDPEESVDARFDALGALWLDLAAGDLGYGAGKARYNEAVYQSEKATANRNYALAYLMMEKKAFPEGADLHAALDLYFRICALELSVDRMAIVAATLANAGVCPLTNRRVLSVETVKNVLSLMSSCGMYDFSGEFAFTIGLPAKSGVSGVLMAVVPGVLGFAVWSPRLDPLGNSVRGVAFCRRLVERYHFHMYDGLAAPVSKHDPTERRSWARGLEAYQLIQAAGLGDLVEVRRLLAHGSSVNAADYDRRTPLHLAAAEGCGEVVRYLLAHGADAQAVDRWGATAADAAEQSGHSEIAALLRGA